MGEVIQMDNHRKPTVYKVVRYKGLWYLVGASGRALSTFGSEEDAQKIADFMNGTMEEVCDCASD